MATTATTIFHAVTLCLWCLLIPLAIRMIQIAPSSVRLALAMGLGRFLFLTFLVFYIWTSTQGTNEILINLLARLYIAADATVIVMVMEHWHALTTRSATNANGRGKRDRRNHLILTISLLLAYWGWLIFGFTQLHLR